MPEKTKPATCLSAGIDTEVAVIGAGPAGLMLSFILSGWIPYYDDETYGPHPNRGLHEVLLPYRKAKTATSSTPGRHQCLLDAVHDPSVVDYVDLQIESFYSSTVLAPNLLVDALQASDESQFASLSNRTPRIKWIHEPERAVDHKVLCATESAGGQWESKTIDLPSDLSLSYAEMLSLPLFPFSQHYEEVHKKPPPVFFRPPRGSVADYYSAWPHKVGIKSVVYNCVASCVTKCLDGHGYNIKCSNGRRITARRVVLASGVFDDPTVRRRLNCPVETATYSDSTCTCDYYVSPISSPLLEASANNSQENRNMDPLLPTLVVGTGVSAADAICNAKGPVIHLFKWDDAQGRPCTFRNFPRELYPEYAQVFKWMKQRRLADESYEGFANARILSVSPQDGSVVLALDDGSTIKRKVGAIRIRTGRSGSLAYLAPDVMPVANPNVTKESMREFVEKSRSLQVGEGLFIVGSLCGDSLVRFLSGGCMWVAGMIQG
jgi:hypothetical protein